MTHTRGHVPEQVFLSPKGQNLHHSGRHVENRTSECLLISKKISNHLCSDGHTTGSPTPLSTGHITWGTVTDTGKDAASMPRGSSSPAPARP